ncbi:GNAT family N-acetyltransferase [Paractinoplanes atraurantiacus]|uniref:Acetyltransferase (GNAT) domain-containing protein n=1 Tax=Paractinoplanes atraurantiacus TaxID=1036182 RepID=A0A285IG69_9ACTN|nr:GNAT family N-acetyltransferase [Actinoplanes atraurantiacus]SNY46086.1 Acetyltransferase (GNAT) domain-containing protein [Actinoplanes atraurantiacus]
MEGSWQISHDAAGVPVADLVALFGAAWWAADRTEDDTRRMLARSDVVVAVTERRSGRLAGFARALTDETYLAVILDVVVAADLRGAGLGALIMESVLGHPCLAGVASVELVCQPEMMAFYHRWGFTEQVGRSRLMRRSAG